VIGKKYSPITLGRTEETVIEETNSQETNTDSNEGTMKLCFSESEEDNQSLEND